MLLGLVGFVVLLKIVLYVGVAGAPLVGDEAYYVDGGKALSNLVRDLVSGHGADSSELRRNVVGNGWFMPGMSLVLAPLYVVAPGASLLLVRGYLALVSTALLLVTALVVRRTFGTLPAGAVLVFPGLVPTYAIFGLAAWGDADAGLVLVLLLCHVVLVLRQARSGRTPRWSTGAGIGLLAITAVYLRSSVGPVVLGLVGAGLVAALLLGAPTLRRRVVLVFAAAGLAFLAALLPWSYAASDSLGGRVTTTTSVPTVMANTFGDRDRVCFGACDPGSSIWFSPLRYSREVARATGVSEVQVQKEMSAYARDRVTPSSYAADVVDNADRYVEDPARFAALLRWSEAPYDVVPMSKLGTNLLFYPALGIGALLMLVVVRRSAEAQVQSLLVKLGIGALLLQPFVHICGPRYWTTAAPLLGLGAALLVTSWRSPGRVEADGVVWFTRAQGLLVAVTVGVTVGVAVLAV